MLNYTEIDLISKYLGDIIQLCQCMLKYKMHMLKIMLSNNIFNWNLTDKAVPIKRANRQKENKDASN